MEVGINSNIPVNKLGFITNSVNNKTDKPKETGETVKEYVSSGASAACNAYASPAIVDRCAENSDNKVNINKDDTNIKLAEQAVETGAVYSVTTKNGHKATIMKDPNANDGAVIITNFDENGVALPDFIHTYPEDVPEYL